MKDANDPTSQSEDETKFYQKIERDLEYVSKEELWFCTHCGHRRRVPTGFRPGAVCVCGQQSWKYFADIAEFPSKPSTNAAPSGVE